MNFATERARVIAPPAVTGRQLISAVESAGYSAELAAPDGAPTTRLPSTTPPSGACAAG